VLVAKVGEVLSDLRKAVDLPDWVEVAVVPPLKSDVPTPRSDSLLLGGRPFRDVQADGPVAEHGHIERDNQLSHAHDCWSS